MGAIAIGLSFDYAILDELTWWTGGIFAAYHTKDAIDYLKHTCIAIKNTSYRND